MTLRAESLRRRHGWCHLHGKNYQEDLILALAEVKMSAGGEWIISAILTTFISIFLLETFFFIELMGTHLLTESASLCILQSILTASLLVRNLKIGITKEFLLSAWTMFRWCSPACPLQTCEFLKLCSETVLARVWLPWLLSCHSLHPEIHLNRP